MVMLFVWIVGAMAADPSAVLETLCALENDEATARASMESEREWPYSFGSQLLHATGTAMTRVLKGRSAGRFDEIPVAALTKGQPGALFDVENCPNRTWACFLVPVRSRCGPRKQSRIDELLGLSYYEQQVAFSAAYWVPTESIAGVSRQLRESLFGSEAPKIAVGLHVSGSDKLTADKSWSLDRVVASAANRARSGGDVVVLTKNLTVVTELSSRLPVTVHHLNRGRPENVTDLAFLFAALDLLADADTVVANSRSTLGVSLFLLQSARRNQPGPPDIIDIDDQWTSSSMAQGYAPCALAWGPRRGLCKSLDEPPREGSGAKSKKRSRPPLSRVS